MEVKNFEVEMIDVESIKLDETNPNEMSREKMDALRKIMVEKGFLQPIIVDQNGTMVDGEHRYIVYREMGMKKIPGYRLNLTDNERRILRQTMNKLRGQHNPREDIDDLILISKEIGVQELSKYLGVEDQNLQDYINSINQVPESWLEMDVVDRSKVGQRRVVTLRLTDEQAKKILKIVPDLDFRGIVFEPISGMVVDNIGKEGGYVK